MRNKMISLLIMFTLTAGAFGIFGGITENASASPIPEYTDGYGYNNDTQVMHDTNGFKYSYQPDGIVKLVLPWGYTTHFSFGLTGDYLGVPQVKTALDYSWSWDILIGECLNETGNLTGYSYTFTATNEVGNLDWTIAFEFNPNARMKVTHMIENGYTNTLENVEFWYIFDLLGTATPYTIETNLGIVEGPLYQEIPDSVYWVRLGNQFQFNWRDALVDYENANAYIGDGSVIGMDGIPILGISLEVGSIASGNAISIDPYFSGVEKTWSAAANGLASNPARWTPVGVPATGDNITFDGTSVFNCNWNVVVTLGNFSMLTGYTGTVTQTVTFETVDFYVGAGTFTGAISQWVTISGNASRITPGNVFSEKLNVIKTGSGNWIEGIPEFVSRDIIFEDDTTIIGRVGALGITINEDVTITISDTDSLYWRYLVHDWVNNGIIEGAGTGYVDLSVHYTNTEWEPGVINAPVTIGVISAATSNRIITLTGDGYMESLRLDSYHATYTLTLIDEGSHILDVSGAVIVDTRSITTQGTGAWSFGSYEQTGEDSVFNQGADLTIGGNFTVSAGVFNAIGDMTVPGNWNTATGSYLNDDNVVYLTGDTKTLAMNSLDSFFNVTVSGSYTMDTDTTVRLRATISGTLAGTGDFLEPLPEFTNDGWPHACPMSLYEHTPTQKYWDLLEINSGPYWLHLIDNELVGLPNENDTGVYYISLTLTWNDMITYQNYTLIVCPETLSDKDIFYIMFAFQLILFVIGLIGYFRLPFLLIFTVMATFVVAVPTIIYFGDLYIIAFILIMMNMMVGVMGLLKVRRKRNV